MGAKNASREASRNAVKPIYTDHALKQMKARGVTKREVEAVLAKPGVTSAGRLGPQGPTLILRATVSGRRLKVVVSDTDPMRVITVACPDE